MATTNQLTKIRISSLELGKTGQKEAASKENVNYSHISFYM